MKESWAMLIQILLFGKRPTVHFKEYRPTQAAGPRTLPPISEPQESGEPPKAIKAEHPPEEPPGDKLVFRGLSVSPQNDRHSKAMIACGRFVRQYTIAPASMRT